MDTPIRPTPSGVTDLGFMSSRAELFSVWNKRSLLVDVGTLSLERGAECPAELDRR